MRNSERKCLHPNGFLFSCFVRGVAVRVVTAGPYRLSDARLDFYAVDSIPIRSSEVSSARLVISSSFHNGRGLLTHNILEVAQYTPYHRRRSPPKHLGNPRNVERQRDGA